MNVHISLFPFLPCLCRKDLTCSVGKDFPRLWHVGWEQCSYGLTSIPLESCHPQGNPAGAATELLDGSLKLCYSTTSFSERFPHRSLPTFSRLGSRGQLHTRSGDAAAAREEGDSIPVRRVRLTRMTRPGLPVHSRPDMVLPTPRLHPPES